MYRLRIVENSKEGEHLRLDRIKRNKNQKDYRL